VAVDRPRIGTRNAEGDRVLEVDLASEESVKALLSSTEADQIYHLAACHHSSESIGNVEVDHAMVRSNFITTEVILSAVARYRPKCRILYAGSSQMYTAPTGATLAIDEQSTMAPSSFYGLTKSWSREVLTYYREKRGIFAETAILFNHESPLRREQYLTRKVSLAAARAKCGYPELLKIRDITSRVDWSSAKDVVRGMWLALGNEVPMDYVFGSGRLMTVENVLEAAFSGVGLDWRAHTTVEATAHKALGGALVADIRRATSVLGWRPTIDFTAMIHEMVTSDREIVGGCGT